MALGTLVRDVKEVIRRLRNRGISFDANRQYPSIPMIDDSIQSHTAALRAIREAMETHERRNPRATLDSFVRLYELEDVLGGFVAGETTINYITNIEGGGVGEFATLPETDAGVLETKAIHPHGGAYAYDRFRYVGQHAAGKGTEAVLLVPDTGVVTVNCALSNVFEIILTGDVVFANPLNQVKGQTVNILIRQDSEGGHAATFEEDWTFVNKIDPTLTQDADATDLLSCQWDATAGFMRCTLQPNYGAGFEPPDPPDASDLVFLNVGGGNEVYAGTEGLVTSFRTFVAEGDIEVETVGDTIVIRYTTPSVTSVQYMNDLLDVDVPSPQVGDTLAWNGTAWVPATARRWTLGATWTNGPNALILPVNVVNSVISEKCDIVGWYLLTGGGNGSCTVDILRVPTHEFPPLDVDTICGGNEPGITSAYMASDTDLTGWDVHCEQDDLLQFRLTASDTFTVVQIILILEKRA